MLQKYLYREETMPYFVAQVDIGQSSLGLPIISPFLPLNYLNFFKLLFLRIVI